MAALLKDALKPNLVQTLEGTPAFVHGGPFANIAHGCNSVMATRMAMALGDIAITEAGFGADLGAEKFCDIKCRMAGIAPNAVVIVATVKALKMNGGVAKADLAAENLEALERGLPNLLQHVENMTQVFGMPVVVAINRHPSDTEAELALVESKCAEHGVNAVLSEVWAKGGEGGIALAEEVLRLVEQPSELSFSLPGRRRHRGQAICAVATKIYHADGVDFDPGRPQADRARCTRSGLRQRPRVHRQDPVQLLRRPQPAGRAAWLQHDGARGQGVRRCRLRRRTHR